MTISAPTSPARPQRDTDWHGDLPAAVTERLNILRPHIQGRTTAEVGAMVDQAFRNFHGLDTGHLVRLLTAATS